jgi:hypothetical protein
MTRVRDDLLTFLSKQPHALTASSIADAFPQHRRSDIEATLWSLVGEIEVYTDDYGHDRYRLRGNVGALSLVDDGDLSLTGTD